jgi:hypothetical protein
MDSNAACLRRRNSLKGERGTGKQSPKDEEKKKKKKRKKQDISL